MRSILNSSFEFRAIRRSAPLAYPCAVIAFIAFCAVGSDSALAQTGGKSGCATQADPTLGQVLGGLAGGLAGNQIGKGDGNVAATIGGVLLGGIAGGEVQKQMQKPDCKTNEKAKPKPKPKTQPKTQEATKPAAPAPGTPAAAPIAAGAIATGAMATDVIADSPNTATAAQDQPNSTLQSQYAAAKAMYESHPVYRQRIDKMIAQSLADYDATRDTETAMETQFRESGIKTQFDARIGELRDWIAANRNNIAAKHVELTDKFREMVRLKRQQADEWSKQASRLNDGSQTATDSSPSLEAGATTQGVAATPPSTSRSVPQISAEFDQTDTDADLKRKRGFLFSLLTLESNTYDKNDKDYQDGLKTIQNEFPEFYDEAIQFSTDTTRRDILEADYNADSQARILTDAAYKAKFMDIMTKTLTNLDTYADMVTKSEQTLKAKNIVTKYDGPLVALREKIEMKRSNNTRDFIFLMDANRYFNLVNLRADDGNARLIEKGYFDNSTDAEMSNEAMAKSIDSIIIADSKSWVMHQYDLHSVKNVKITKTDSNGQPAIIHADFTYNQGERGWIDVHYKANKLSCVIFFDFPDTCRAVGKSPGGDIASELIWDMFGPGGGSSNSSGGGDICEQNPQLKQCGGSSYEPSYSPPAPSPPPISSFYGSNHTPW